MRYTVCQVAATADAVRLVLTAPHVPSVLPAPNAQVVVLEDVGAGAEAVLVALEAIEEITSDDDLIEIAQAVARQRARLNPAASAG